MAADFLHGAFGGVHYPSLCCRCIARERELDELRDVARAATTHDGWVMAMSAWASALLGED